MEILARKKVLCTNIGRMKRVFGSEFGFIPTEFLIPEQKKELHREVELNPKRWYIAKPSKGFGGEGIFIFKGKPDLPSINQEFVI